LADLLDKILRTEIDARRGDGPKREKHICTDIVKRRDDQGDQVVIAFRKKRAVVSCRRGALKNDPKSNRRLGRRYLLNGRRKRMSYEYLVVANAERLTTISRSRSRGETRFRASVGEIKNLAPEAIQGGAQFKKPVESRPI